MKSMLADLDSQATSKPQPSKSMNGGSAKIDGANPTSPSTNPATRREQYNNYIKTLDRDQLRSLYSTVKNYREMGLTDSQIYDNVLSSAERNRNGVVTTSNISPTTNINTAPTTSGDVTPNHKLDLKAKGNFDMYESTIDPNSGDATFQKAISQLNDSVRWLGSLKLASENFQYTTWSTNVADINNLIKEIQKAYSAWIYDTTTIANQLWVDPEVVRKIQQGKASELVSIWEEFAQKQLKDFFRAEEDYDINLQRTMEDYELEKTNLDAQFNSAMQTLKRNLFDEKRAASVWSAVAGISGSEYMVQRVEKWYQQNMDDLETNYMYSTLKQRTSYLRAIQDYNKNIARLWEDFDEAVKSIQLSVLQQFQEIDNKIMSAEDNLKALSKLQWNTSTAMSDAILKYISWIEDANERQRAMQNFIAANYWYDVSQLGGWGTSQVETAYNNFMTTYKDVIAQWGAIRKWRCGEPVNEYLKFLGSNLQISQAKDLAKYATDRYPTPGAIAYFDWTQSRATANTKKYWHTWIVVSVDPDKWTVTVLDSNGSNKMWLWYTTYKLSDVTWYYTPGSTWGGTQVAGSEAANNAFMSAADLAVNPNRSVSFQKQFTDTVQKFINAGNYDEALEYILSKSVTWLWQEEKNQLNAAQNALWQLASIQIALKQYERMWWETWLFAGLEEDVASKIGKVKDPKLRALATQINTAIINYRKAITGAWFSSKETKEYQSIFPNTKNSKALNTAIIDWALDGMLTTINTKYADTIWTTTYTELLKAYESVKGSPYSFRASKQELMRYLKNEWLDGEVGELKGKRWTYTPRTLSSLTNPSSQAASDIFSNPGRAVPMSVAWSWGPRWTYQTIMPK